MLALLSLFVLPCYGFSAQRTTCKILSFANPSYLNKKLRNDLIPSTEKRDLIAKLIDGDLDKVVLTSTSATSSARRVQQTEVLLSASMTYSSHIEWIEFLQKIALNLDIKSPDFFEKFGKYFKLWGSNSDVTDSLNLAVQGNDSRLHLPVIRVLVLSILSFSDLKTLRKFENFLNEYRSFTSGDNETEYVTAASLALLRRLEEVPKFDNRLTYLIKHQALGYYFLLISLVESVPSDSVLVEMLHELKLDDNLFLVIAQKIRLIKQSQFDRLYKLANHSSSQSQAVKGIYFQIEIRNLSYSQILTKIPSRFLSGALIDLIIENAEMSDLIDFVESHFEVLERYLKDSKVISERVRKASALRLDSNDVAFLRKLIKRSDDFGRFSRMALIDNAWSNDLLVFETLSFLKKSEMKEFFWFDRISKLPAKRLRYLLERSLELESNRDLTELLSSIVDPVSTLEIIENHIHSLETVSASERQVEVFSPLFQQREVVDLLSDNFLDRDLSRIEELIVLLLTSPDSHYEADKLVSLGRGLRSSRKESHRRSYSKNTKKNAAPVLNLQEKTKTSVSFSLEQFVLHPSDFNSRKAMIKIIQSFHNSNTLSEDRISVKALLSIDRSVFKDFARAMTKDLYKALYNFVTGAAKQSLKISVLDWLVEVPLGEQHFDDETIRIFSAFLMTSKGEFGLEAAVKLAESQNLDLALKARLLLTDFLSPNKFHAFSSEVLRDRVGFAFKLFARWEGETGKKILALLLLPYAGKKNGDLMEVLDRDENGIIHQWTLDSASQLWQPSIHSKSDRIPENVFSAILALTDNDADMVDARKRSSEIPAMHAAMAYEIEVGRVPIDVSLDTDLGYDVLSIDFRKNRLLHIEVKGKSARVGVHSIYLTHNELNSAKNLDGSYFVYVVEVDLVRCTTALTFLRIGEDQEILRSSIIPNTENSLNAQYGIWGLVHYHISNP